MTVDARVPVGARLDRLPVRAFHILVLVVASLSLFFDTLDSVLTGFVLAAMRVDWQFPVAMIGILSAVGTAGYWVGSFFSGFVADRIGRRQVILYTLLAYSAFSVSRGFANDVVVFGILNFFTWVFVGAESSVVPVYLAEMWQSDRRARLNGWMMMFFALGLAGAPLWSWLIIPHLGWRWALFLTGPFAILVVIMRQRLPESPRWLERVGRTKDADEVTTQIEHRVVPDGQLAPLAPVPAVTSDPPVSVSALLAPGFRRRTIMLWCAWFAQYGVLYAFLTFVPTLLSLDGINVTKSLAYSVVIYSAYIPGYVLGGYLADRLDRKWLIVSAFTGVAVFGTLFGSTRNPGLIMLFGALTALFAGFGATGVYTYTPELYPTEIRATAMGIASSWGRVGSITLLLIFGIFAVAQGKLALFLVADVILAVAIVAVIALGPRTYNRSLEDLGRSAVR